MKLRLQRQTEPRLKGRRGEAGFRGSRGTPSGSQEGVLPAQLGQCAARRCDGEPGPAKTGGAECRPASRAHSLGPTLGVELHSHVVTWCDHLRSCQTQFSVKALPKGQGCGSVMSQLYRQGERELQPTLGFPDEPLWKQEGHRWGWGARMFLGGPVPPLLSHGLLCPQVWMGPSQPHLTGLNELLCASECLPVILVPGIKL